MAIAVARIVRMFDFVLAVHAAVCDNDRLSLLAGSRAQLETMEWEEVIALRDAAFALAALAETRALDFDVEVN